MTGQAGSSYSENLQLTVLSELTRLLNDERDYHSLLPDVCQLLMQELGVAGFLIFSAQEKEDYDIIRLEYGQAGTHVLTAGSVIPVGEGFIGQTALASERCISSSLGTEQWLLESAEGHSSGLLQKPAAGWPFREDGVLTGVLLLVFSEPPLSGDWRFWDDLAGLFSLYLKPFLLRKRLQRISRKFALLNSFKKVFSGTLELRPVLSVFMNITASTLAAEVGVFVLFKESSLQPDLEINWGLSITDLLNLKSAGGQSLFDCLLEHQEPVVFNDFQDCGFRISEENRFRGVLHSMLGTVLRTQHGPIGVLVFANKSRGRGGLDNGFDEQDQDLFAIMQDKLRVSIENYLLYKQIISIKKFNDNILQSIQSGIVSVDLSGRILMINRRFREIFQLEGEVTGLHLSQVVDLPEFSIDCFERFLQKGAFPPDTEVFWKTAGEMNILSLTLSPLLDEHRKLIGAAVTVNDLTEKRALEGRVKRTEHLAALGELSAGLAHEIKNPLTAMKGFAQLLPKKQQDPVFMDKFSRAIINELMRLDDLTERLLAFARPNVGGLQPIVLQEVVQDTLMLVKYQMDKQKIQWEIDAPEHLPGVMGDATRLTQVFLNIILNAIHAMKDGGELLIKFSVLHNWKSPKGITDAVLVEFNDSGSGISDENMAKLFNPFFTTKETGTGLGLSISFRIIEEHNGLIEVVSEEDRGSSFKIVLPAIPEES